MVISVGVGKGVDVGAGSGVFTVLIYHSPNFILIHVFLGQMLTTRAND